MTPDLTALRPRDESRGAILIPHLTDGSRSGNMGSTHQRPSRAADAEGPEDVVEKQHDAERWPGSFAVQPAARGRWNLRSKDGCGREGSAAGGRHPRRWHRRPTNVGSNGRRSLASHCGVTPRRPLSRDASIVDVASVRWIDASSLARRSPRCGRLARSSGSKSSRGRPAPRPAPPVSTVPAESAMTQSSC